MVRCRRRTKPPARCMLRHTCVAWSGGLLIKLPPQGVDAACVLGGLRVSQVSQAMRAGGVSRLRRRPRILHPDFERRIGSNDSKIKGAEIVLQDYGATGGAWIRDGIGSLSHWPATLGGQLVQHEPPASAGGPAPQAGQLAASRCGQHRPPFRTGQLSTKWLTAHAPSSSAVSTAASGVWRNTLVGSTRCLTWGQRGCNGRGRTEVEGHPATMCKTQLEGKDACHAPASQ